MRHAQLDVLRSWGRLLDPRVEPTGTEPVTSCLQSPRESGRLCARSGFRPENRPIADAAKRLAGSDPRGWGFHKASTASQGLPKAFRS
jgi:hypothetical protein